MAVAEKFSKKMDARNKTVDSTFNGDLRTYLAESGENLDPVLKAGFEQTAEENPDVRIIVNYREKINRDTISNEIIRYKDVFKLTGKPLLFPYILYMKKDDKERALLIFPYSEDSFLYAKGAYYCLTEQNAEFEQEKNEIVSISPSSCEQMVQAFRDLFTMHAGALQRKIDHECFQSYDELKSKAERASDHLIHEAYEKLPELKERTAEIYKLVVSWFLLKKVLYVQYMMDKNVLMTVHAGSIRKQRSQAKINADCITFIAYSTLWRMGTDLDVQKGAASNA